MVQVRAQQEAQQRAEEASRQQAAELVARQKAVEIEASRQAIADKVMSIFDLHSICQVDDPLAYT